MYMYMCMYACVYMALVFAARRAKGHPLQWKVSLQSIQFKRTTFVYYKMSEFVIGV